MISKIPSEVRGKSKKANMTKNQYGEISIGLERETFTSGEELHGHIYITIYQNFKASILEVKFKGAEKVIWKKKEGKDKYEGEGHFFNECGTIMRFPNDIVPGQYAYPFVIQLSGLLPSTFETNFYENEKEIEKAFIRYSVKGFLRSHMDIGMPGGQESGAGDLITKKYFMIRPALPLGEAAVNIRQNFTDIHRVGCICCGKGQTQIEAFLPSERIQMDQGIILNYRVDNTACSYNIKALVFQLFQVMCLKTNKGDLPGKYTHRTCITTITETERIPKKQATDFKTVTLLAPLPPSGEGRYFDLKKYPRPTINTNLITCEYFIRIRPSYNGSCKCCYKGPEVNVYLMLMIPVTMGVPRAPATGNWDMMPQYAPQNPHQYVPQHNYMMAPQTMMIPDQT